MSKSIQDKQRTQKRDASSYNLLPAAEKHRESVTMINYALRLIDKQGLRLGNYWFFKFTNSFYFHTSSI